MASVTFSCQLESGNAAFEDDPRSELEDILHSMITQIRRGRDGGKLMDSNGNSVGTWGLGVEEDEEEDDEEQTPEDDQDTAREEL